MNTIQSDMPNIDPHQEQEQTSQTDNTIPTWISDRDSSSENEHPTPPSSPKSTENPTSSLAPSTDVPDDSCVVCFERDPNVTLEPCGHSNLCSICLSRLMKRRCPTCRARARRVTIHTPGEDVVTKAVKEIIAERKERENRIWEDTLQILFLGPEKVGKKTLVRKLISKYPCECQVPSNSTSTDSHLDVFSDGTDFSPNATINGVNVRLTVLRRTTLTSRRMVIDDVRVLKPDVLVLCCSAHDGSTFETILLWDKVLRENCTKKPRVWALLTLDDPDGENGATFDTDHDVAGAINVINPPHIRPKGHYLCSPGEQFSIGFRSLAKAIVSIGRIARDEGVAELIAQQEANSMNAREAAGTLDDHAAASRVVANNGIGVPSSSGTGSAAHRNTSNSRNTNGLGRSFSLRLLRDRGGNGNNGNGPGISLSGFVNWLAGSHDS